MPIRPGGNGQVLFTGVEMERLAWFLGTRLGRPVLDRTGLTGAYDFTLSWASAERPVGPGDPGDSPADEVGPSLFSAVRQQLGLRLESRKGPVVFLTIEHLERPTEN